MLRAIKRILPDSFKHRFLALFIAFSLISGLASSLVQYVFDKHDYRQYASETVINIHNSVEERMRDAILYDDIYLLFSTAESIADSVSLVSNVIITDGNGSYITDAEVTKEIPDETERSVEYFDIKLSNGKKNRQCCIRDKFFGDKQQSTEPYSDKPSCERACYPHLYIFVYKADFVFYEAA